MDFTTLLYFVLVVLPAFALMVAAVVLAIRSNKTRRRR